jgi:hypothetical protein
MTWTQDQAIAFECARDVITDMIGICSAAIAEEESKPVPDAARLAALEEAMARLGDERRSLRLFEHDKIARINKEYGEHVRKHRESPSP